MSFKKGKTTKTFNNSSATTSNALTTPIVPEWITSSVQKGAGLVDKVANLAPTSLIAPAQSLQTRAESGAASLGQWTQSQIPGLPKGPGDSSWLAGVANANAPIASGGKGYDYVDRYLNPYLKEVVDSSAKDIDEDTARTRAQLDLNLAGSGAFGGSGAALAKSITEGELARARASTLSGLKQRAYETALGAASGDADRATQARIANAQNKLQDRAQKIDLGFRSQAQQLAVDENSRANIAAQAGLGDALRGVDAQTRMAPVTHAQQVAALLGGLPLQLFPGQQKTEATNQVQSGKEKTKETGFGASVGDIVQAGYKLPGAQ